MSELLPKILVVDDEPWNLELMEAYLSSDYELIMATNGVEALEKVKDFEPDVILLDVLMPKMDGYQTCEILKKDDSTKFIPVVLVTALSEKEDKIKGIESGADEFLSKPVDMLELKTRVHSLLKLKQQQDMVRKERDTAQKYLDVAGVMILIIDNDQNIVEINKKGKTILECSEEDLIGKNYFDNFI
ncbi:MAG: response regulator, partial [Methanococcoides sp.]|nr:response regulator [Methanococcoides sp.]